MSNFGPVSRSEITFFFTRAAVGAGCEFGVGEDVAKAAVLLANLGFDPAIIVSGCLKALSKGESVKPTMRGVDAQLELESSSEGNLSAIYASILVGDWLDANANKQDMQICMKNIDNALLAIAMLWSRSLDDVCYQVSVGDLSDCNGLDEILKAITNNDHLSDITVSLISKPQKKVKVNTDAGIFVDAKAWQNIVAYFNKCLVPATAESRLSGAGAGASDND